MWHKHRCPTRKAPEGLAAFHAVDFLHLPTGYMCFSLFDVSVEPAVSLTRLFLTVLSVDFILHAFFLDNIRLFNDGNAFREMPHQVFFFFFFLCSNLIPYVHTSWMAHLMSPERPLVVNLCKAGVSQLTGMFSALPRVKCCRTLVETIYNHLVLIKEFFRCSCGPIRIRCHENPYPHSSALGFSAS